MWTLTSWPSRRSAISAAANLAEDDQRYRLDYRTAYRVVGRAVAAALARGEDELTVPVVRAAPRRCITGTELPVTAELLSAVTDPALVVAARNAPGGASPDRVQEHARRCGAAWGRHGQGTPPAGPATPRPKPP